jgi:hypothetical protein
VVALFLFAPLPANARLGETIPQLATRYGQPVEQTTNDIPGTTDFSYVKSDTVIVATVRDSTKTCIAIGYAKLKPVPLTRVEINTLLNANAGTNIWRKLDDHIWQRSDKQASANYQASSATFYFFTTEYHTLSDQAKQQKMAGF